MVLYEIGTDIQKVNDFENVKESFLNKIFTKKEIDYCLKRSNPPQHFAARFSVKEAIIKAFSQFNEKIYYTDVETLIYNKKPKINILKKLSYKYTIKISLSHSGDYAVGFAIVKKWKN